MRLSVAANYDSDIIEQLAHQAVDEVYGKFSHDLAGGGRPTYMGAALSERQLGEYVRRLAEHGIAFNYLLNSSCLSNREWGRRWQRGLERLLNKLWDIGIRRLTVSTPYLLERIKRTFSNFSIRVGVYAQVDTARRARFWEDLGADNITVESFSINRDFGRLAAIRDAVDCDLTLIANHPCLPNCAMQPYHQGGFAHSSNGSRELFIDYCFLKCTYARLRDPSNLIKSCWIRPEDTGFYERMGYAHFKILERDIPSAELLKRVACYAERRSPANLADLILPYGFNEPKGGRRATVLRHFFKPRQIHPLKLKRLYDFARRQGMLFAGGQQVFEIDSSRIPDDFVESFRNHTCAETDCRDCGYCEEIAARCIRLNEDIRRDHLARLEAIHDELVSGAMWHA